MAQIEVWSDLHQDLVTDSHGSIKKVINVDAVATSIDNILNTNLGERCLSGGTLVSLLNGTNMPIKDLIGKGKFWVYSYNHRNCTIEPGLAIAFKTGKCRVIKIVLDNEQVIKCTLDHKFMLRDGTYKEAGQLAVGDSLMPLYRQVDKFGYEMVYQPMYGVWEKTHIMVAKWKIGNILKTHCVHHKNFDKCNNIPTNLSVNKRDIHFLYHSRHTKEHNKILWSSEKFIKFAKSGGCLPKMVGTEEYSKRISNGQKKLRSDPIIDAKLRFFSKLAAIKTNSMPGAKERSAKSGRINGKKFWSEEKYKESRIKNKISKKCGYDIWSKTIQGKQFLNNLGSNTGKISINCKINKYYNDVIKLYGKFNKENFDKYRELRKNEVRNGILLWSTVSSVLPQTIINHKVLYIEQTNIIEEVYDLFVESNNNFALTSGIFVHNCMLPQFGGSLRGILFDPIARSMASVIAKEIKRCIETWDNRVSVANIEIFEKPDDNRIDIEVAFTIAGYSESFTYTANVT